MSQISQKSYTIAEFFITTDFIKKIQICKGHRNDCTINAFELLKIFDSQFSSLMREDIKSTGGMFDNHFFDLLSNAALKLGYNFSFFYNTITNHQIFDFVLNHLQPNHAVIVRFRHGNIKHVFIIAKDQHNKIYIIDHQENKVFCDITSKTCQKYLLDGNKTNWEIITAQPKPTIDISDVPDIDTSVDELGFGFSNRITRKSFIKNRRGKSNSYSFGVFGGLKQKALSMGKSALQQAKQYGEGIADDLKNEAVNTATQLKEQAKSQATQLKEQAKSQATQLKEQAKTQATQQIQKL